MKILFTFPHPHQSSIQIMEKSIEIEGVGFENDFNSSASMFEENAFLVWQTAWSGFRYLLPLDGSLFDPYRNDWFYLQYPWTQRMIPKSEATLMIYEGAEMGFLSQDLFPVFPGIDKREILGVEGSHGLFRREAAQMQVLSTGAGPCTLEQYREKKTRDREEFRKLCSVSDSRLFGKLCAVWAQAQHS